MKRRGVARARLGVIAVALGAGSCAGRGGPAPPSPPDDARVLMIADAVVKDTFERTPELVALLRPPSVKSDALPDESATAEREQRAREDRELAELGRVDRAKLASHRAALAYDLAEEVLEARRDARVCRHELWSVGQMNGFQVRFANLAQAQPLGAPGPRAEALARFSGLPRYVDVHLANLREGLRLGYTQAAVNVEQVISQLDKLATADPKDSPYMGPALRDPDEAFAAAWGAVVQKDVLPALSRYREFLQTEYLPRARKAFGVAANPDGAACYAASLRQYTTMRLDAAQVHEQGKAELERIVAEMRALSQKSFGTDDFRATLKKLSTDPALLHRSKDDVTRQATAALARARAAMPRAFRLMPEADVAVEPIPAYQEKTAAAHYLMAALDGSRPATYRIRLYQADKQSTSLGESTAFHETIPGHHLQLNIANARRENPDIARFLFNSGFGEGWALYAERLADELGLYTSDVDRMGMLSNSAWRAVRLIVDTGLHAFGWERERAIATMLEYTALSREQAAQEVDRYISWPGQATSYMVGYLEIAALRREAERALGPRFDLRDFHDRVLEDGAVPLPVLRRKIERWIADRAGRP